MPSASITNTTGETGRNVPVPRSRMRKPVFSADACSRCRSIAGTAASSTSNGGISVTCVGMPWAVVSPSSAR